MFHAIVVFLVSGFVAVNSEMRSLLPTQCNVMYKASCQQFRVVGDHNMICGDRPQYNHCQQTCHSASCRLRCNAHITCQQQCAAGRCDVMTCTSGNCSQSCIRSGCKMDCAGNECQQHCYMGGCNMECSPTAERCFQSCEMGKCNMRCPAGVKACEQTCKGGRCIMICEAKTCKRSCEEGGQCSYSTKVARESKDLAPRYCDGSAGSDRNCLQACVEGRCKLKYKYSDHSSIVQLCHGGNCEFDCKAPLKCTQICTGGRCRKYVCNSKLCIQECVAGGCLMECEAETCFQMCRGGDCSMHCFSNVNDCFQWCTGGNCILKCSAKHCNPFCNTAKCITDGERPRLKAMKRRVRCTMTTRQCKQVCPPKRSCAFMGWKHLHVFHSTNQVCDEGDCRQMVCYASKSCNQICNDGACGRMACKSDTCVQDCLGANCNMDCRARNCTQLCRGGGCKMTCRGNTETCIQLCNTRISDCQLICFAKACLITLP